MRRLTKLALATAAAVLVLIAPMSASAYYGPNPINEDWEGVWNLLVDPHSDEAQASSLSNDARTRLWNARKGAGTMPASSSLSSVELGPSTVSIGWKVIRNTDTRWLHFTGNYGTNTKTEGQYGSRYIADKPIGWWWINAGAPLGTENPAWVAPVSGWYLRYSECSARFSGCTPAGTYSALGTTDSTPYPSGTCSQPGLGALPYANLTASLTASGFTSWSYIHTAVSGLNVCYAYMSPAQFEAQMTVDADEWWVAQPFHKTTWSFTVPSDPGESSATATDARAALLSGGPVTDFEIGKLVDSNWEGLDDTTLLETYLPQLRFRSDETYRPSKASLATDTYFTTEPAHANHLDVLGTTIASANPDDLVLDLSLDFLSDRTGMPGAEFEYIDEPSYTHNSIHYDEIAVAPIDYNNMLADNPGEYDNRTYARVVDDPAESGEKILQYWFYYYYNQWQFAGGGDHEGDWEWVQIRIDESGSPISAAFGQHGAGERCDWDNVQTDSGTLVVWPAVGSHANYFHPGTYGVDEVPGPIDGEDETAMAESYLQDDLALIDDTSTEDWGDWLTWEGRWGASGDPGAPSPESPGRQSAWEDAFAWHDNADGSGESCDL